MTRSSESRKARRAQHEPEVTKKRDPVMKIPDRPTSVIRFEDLEGGGYTFSLGLYGALLSQMNPDRSVPVSTADIMALAVAHLIRTNSKELQDACTLVSGMLHKVHQDIEAGLDVEDVMKNAALSVAEEPQA